MIKWNEEIFTKYQQKAITDPSQLKIGETYFSNFWTGGKIVQQLLTHFDFYDMRDHSMRGVLWEKDAPIRWVIYTDDSYDSLHDSNIGAHYNPWLLFDNEQAAIECQNELNETIIY